MAMMNRNNFLFQMKRLTEVYSHLSELALEDYYNQFKYFELEIFTKAISILIGERFNRAEDSKEFTPKPFEILGVINDIRKQSSESYPEEEPPAPICDACEGTGFKTWIGKDGRLKATPCVKCRKGKRIINAPLIKNKRPDYPDGWKEIYNKKSWGNVLKGE